VPIRALIAIDEGRRRGSHLRCYIDRKRRAITLTRDQLVARMIRAGEVEVSGSHQAEIEPYFDTSKFHFHGPDGFEADYAKAAGRTASSASKIEPAGT
jgi:hypothetical protein